MTARQLKNGSGCVRLVVAAIGTLVIASPGVQVELTSDNQRLPPVKLVAK